MTDFVLLPYGDGDTDGWVWDGTAHNSSSHQVRYVPQARRPFGAGVSLRVTSPGGRGVDLSQSCDGFSCSRDEWGGFDTATWEQKVDPRRYLEELAPLGDVLATFDGETIFEGRITDVGKEVRGEDGGVRRVTARGYFDALKDDEAFQRCYIDKDLTRWEDLPATNRGGFDVIAGQDDMAGVFAIESQKYEQNASARVVYRLLGGLATSGESLRYFGVTVVDTITDADWEVRLYSRATPAYANNLALLWTSTGTGTHNLTFNTADLDPGSTGTSRCLVLQVIHTGATVTSFVGYNPDNLPGAKLTAFTVKGSTVASASPENVIADLVADVTTAAQRSFPDATGLTVGQLVFDSPTTRLECIEQVNEMMRWQYGFKAGGVFEYRRPWPLAEIPDRSHYDLLWAEVAPSLSFDFSECYNRVVVRYSDKRGNQHTYTATATVAALGTLTRTASIEAPEGVFDATNAQTVAEAFLADHGKPVVSGRIPLTGLVRLIDGRERHCCHVAPGEYVSLRDAPPEEEHTLRITRVELDPGAQSSTIEIGRNPSRLDRLLARMQSKARRRRK